MNGISNIRTKRRLAALARYEIMDTEPEADFDDLTRLVGQICGVPMATVTLLDEHRQWFKARMGMAESETPIEYAFCAHAIQLPEEVLCVPDASLDLRFRDNPSVIGDPNIRFYMGAPLITPEGVPIGTVCAIDTKPHCLNLMQGEALRMLARQTVALLELRRTTRERQREQAYMRHLQGMLPACPCCQKKRGEDDYWAAVEESLDAQIDMTFAPARCPDCRDPKVHTSSDSTAIGSDQLGAARRCFARGVRHLSGGESADAEIVLSSQPGEAPHELPTPDPLWDEVTFLKSELQVQEMRFDALQTRETYFRHLTEYALDLITILETDGTIRFESRSIECELGHSPAHYRGKNAFEFVHPEDRPFVMASFVEALERNGNTPVIRFRFQHANGTFRILEGTGNNLLDDPAVRGIVFNSRDVTEQVQLQDAVDRARLEKEDIIARLTGGVAHDFNNILSAVQGLAELAAARLARGSAEAGYLSDIQSATRRAAELTRQLLAFSRRAVLQPCAIELKSWLRGLESQLAVILGSEIELTIVSNGDLRVWEDPTQFEQVLLQLANNARDAMPAGGRFTIEAMPIILGPHERPVDGRDVDIRYVLLSVADQGQGMNEATLARIFDPFFTTKIFGRHPGLGLCMCRGIVEQSGGHLTVRSHPGRGTVFNLFLPEAELIEKVTPPPPGVVSDVPTILFVDDEPLLREIGETILLEAGYRVIVAEDGAEALARLSELGTTPLDLLITDVIMPGITGVQLAEEVCRQRPGTRVLLCSGYTRDALAQSGGIPAGLAFLPKPYSLAKLLARVGELLNVVEA